MDIIVGCTINMCMKWEQFQGYEIPTLHQTGK